MQLPLDRWDRDVDEDTTLKELEWLIGTWQAAGKDREVTTTYEWDENKVFIRGKYSVKEGDKVIESGTQMILSSISSTFYLWPLLEESKIFSHKKLLI